MGRKWEVRYVTYSSMVPFVSVALSEWGLGDLGPEPSREKSAVCNPNVTRDSFGASVYYSSRKLAYALSRHHRLVYLVPY